MYAVPHARETPSTESKDSHFICVEKKLIIELDGKSHEGKRSYDQRRKKYLEECGLRVFRCTNDDVEDDVENVLKRIAEVINREA